MIGRQRGLQLISLVLVFVFGEGIMHAQVRTWVDRRHKALDELPAHWVASSALQQPGKDWSAQVRDFENAVRSAQGPAKLLWETRLAEARWQRILTLNVESMQESLRSIRDWRQGARKAPVILSSAPDASWLELETQLIGLLQRAQDPALRVRLVEVLSGLYLLSKRHEQAQLLIQKEGLDSRVARWIRAEALGLGQGWGFAEPELQNTPFDDVQVRFWAQLRLAREYEQLKPELWIQRWRAVLATAASMGEGREWAQLLVRELLASPRSQVPPATLAVLLREPDLAPHRSQILLMAFLQARSPLQRDQLYAVERFDQASAEAYVLGQSYFDELRRRRELPKLLLPVFANTLASRPWLDPAVPSAKAWTPSIAAWVKEQVQFFVGQFEADRDQQALLTLQNTLDQLERVLHIKDAGYQSLRARLALSLRDADRAAERFQYVAQQDSFRHEQRKAAALAMKSIYQEQVMPLPVGQTATPPRAEVQQGLQRSCQLVRNLVFRDAQARRDCDVGEKRLADRLGDRDAVGRRLWVLAQSYPNGYEGQAAARELIRQAQQDQQGGTAIIDKLLTIPEYQVGSLGQELRELRRTLLFQAIARSERPLEKAERFLLFARSEMEHPLGRRALREAARQFEQIGAYDRAFLTYETQLQERPLDPEAASLQREIIRLAQRTLRLEKARHYLQELVRMQPQASDSFSNRLEICRLDIGMGRSEALQSCLGEAFQDAPGKALQLRLVRAMIRRGDHNAAAHWMKNVYTQRKDLTPDERIQAWALQIEASKNLPVLASDARQNLLQVYTEFHAELNAQSRRQVAALAYQSLKQALDQFLAFHLAASTGDEYVSSVQNLKQSFDELEGLYKRIMQTEDATWGSRALFELSRASQHFAKQLAAAPRLEAVNRKRLEDELRSQVSSLTALARSQAGEAEKTLRKYMVMGPHNRSIINHNRKIRGSDVLFEDQVPGPRWIPVGDQSRDRMLGGL